MLIMSQDYSFVLNSDNIAEIAVAKSNVDPERYCLNAVIADSGSIRTLGEFQSEQKCLGALMKLMDMSKDCIVDEDDTAVRPKPRSFEK